MCDYGDLHTTGHQYSQHFSEPALQATCLFPAAWPQNNRTETIVCNTAWPIP